jgi:hypothetical protein
MEQIQDLPRQTRTRVEGLAAALATLAEQTELLDHEVITMKARDRQQAVRPAGTNA